MFLSRIRPSSEVTALHRLAQIAGGGQYRIHQILWKLFDSDPDAKRDFLFRQEGKANELSFLILSSRRPGDDRGLWLVETKEFAPRLRQGQRLAFSVRINPVVKRRDGDGRQQRHDLVMDLKKNESGAQSGTTQAERVQYAAAQWLGARQQRHGYSLDGGSLIGEAYRQWRFAGKGGRAISFSSIDCTGQLTVIDPARCEQALFDGIGPAKAFGCGLLLVRPA